MKILILTYEFLTTYGVPKHLLYFLTESNEKNGFVFEDGDTNSFANCINNLVDNKSLRKNISLNVRKSVSKLTWKSIAKKINEIYRNKLEFI